MPKTLDIAIIGAGPAGLATGLYLNRLGHIVTLFERFSAPQALGSGLILQPTGLAVLADLGLFDSILALGQPTDRLAGTDARSGRKVLDVGYGVLRGSVRGLGVHRAALFGVLFDAVRTVGLPIRTGWDISALQGPDKGSRRLVSRRGEVSEAFDLVIDCSGARSGLKALSRSPGRTKDLPFGAIWGTVPWRDAGFERHALLQRYQAAKVMIGVLPIGRTMVEGPELASFFWSLKVADYEALRAAGIDRWKSAVAELWPETVSHLAQFSSFDDLTLARYAHHTMGLPFGDRLAFVGDSAHSTSPQLGQGANMALLDARALFLSLRDGGDVGAALERYARLRRWHVRLYQVLSQMFTPFYQSESRVLPAIRDLFVANLAVVPPAPQFLAAMVSGGLMGPLKRLELQRPPIF